MFFIGVQPSTVARGVNVILHAAAALWLHVWTVARLATDEWLRLTSRPFDTDELWGTIEETLHDDQQSCRAWSQKKTGVGRVSVPLERQQVILSDRLRLRDWRDSDGDALAALNADPEVSRDLGGPLSGAESDAKLARYMATFEDVGFCRWLVEDRCEQFLGYAGVMPSRSSHPLGHHFDIGWRLVRSAWGRGYATEAAKASLRDVFERVHLKEVLAYTSADNIRSQAVIKRLDMQRAASLDHSEPVGKGMWRGLVWVAQPSNGLLIQT